MTIFGGRAKEGRKAQIDGSNGEHKLGEGSDHHRGRDRFRAGANSGNRLLRIHLAGVAGSNLIDGMIAGAIPLIAVALTRDPLLVSLVTTAVWVPWLLGSVFVGVAVDRGDRARIRQHALTARVALLIAAGAVAISGSLTIWALIALMFLYAVTEMFADLSAQALVPQIVDKDRLNAANSRILGAETLMGNFVGQPLGGLLVTLGAAWVFSVPAALLVLVVLTVARLRRPEGFVAPHEGDSVEEAVATVRSDVAFGLRRLVQHPVVRPLTISSGLSNLFSTAYTSVLVLWVVGPESRVGLEPWQFPLLMAVLSAGAVLGSLMPSEPIRRAGEFRVAIWAWIVNSLALLVPVIFPTWWAIAAACVVVGFTNMVGNVIMMSVRQRVVPAGLLGRIGGSSRTIVFGSMAIGAPLGGVIAATFGLAAVFWAMPIATILVVLWVATQVNQRVIEEAESAMPPGRADGSR